MSIHESYQRDGFHFPVDVMDEALARALRAEYESAERQVAADRTHGALLKANPHGVLPQMHAVLASAAVTDAVAQVLGEDLLLLKSSMFIKEPASPHFVSWHQDLTYWGLEGDDQVTAWIALSPATVESGCMRFVPGTHRREIVPHQDTFADENLLTRGQEIAVEVDEADAVDVVLEPGQMSLHHGKLFHASRPNRTGDRRIGVAVRYISPAMRMRGGVRNCAILVRGEDRFGHFDLAPPPRGLLHPDDLARELAYKAVQEKFLYEGVEQPPSRFA